MGPLDLTSAPPRPCRAELDGIPFLPRAIDKVRAELPGGNPGMYFSLRGDATTLSSLLYHYAGITHDEFRSVVTHARDEAEIAQWIRTRSEPERLAKFERTLLSAAIGSLSPAGRATLNDVYPDAANEPAETLIVDLIDADDARAFASENS